jgi:hypothetical protein
VFKRIRFNYLPIARNLTNVLVSDTEITLSDNTTGYNEEAESSGSFGIPKGTTAQRSNVAYGMRFNVETKSLEFYLANNWNTVAYTGGGGDGGGNPNTGKNGASGIAIIRYRFQ